MSAPAISCPSRLARIRSTASGTDVPPLGEVGTGEGVRQQGAELTRALVGVDQEPGAAGLEQQLPAPAAWDKRSAVSGNHADPDQPARAGRVQRADETAFSAQGQAERGVLHVA